MAAGTVAITDVIVPSIFTPYTQQLTMEKTAIINAGIAVRDDYLDQLLAGGGLTFNVPSWKDLDADAENVSDDTSSTSSPFKIGTATEVAVRLSRNASWSAMRLAAALAGSDPMQAIAGRVSDYWSRRLQRAFIAVVMGIYNNDIQASPGGTAVQNDLVNSIIGGSYVAGTTDFNAAAFLDTAASLGDAAEDVTAVVMHSLVYTRAQKNNLIDFIPDAEGKVNIPVFLGRRVIVDDGMPNPAHPETFAQTAAGIYHTLLVGPGAFRLGVGTPIVPTEVFRNPDKGNGGGQDTLYNRVEWSIHPVGYKYAGTSPNGGPTNAATANNLAHLGSWARVFPERKQIKLAWLVSRES